ncbi:substrate-binding periplasmic protein [Kordiimonas lipolytica]|uniref:Substrate-binding periplasmic protein n=1 Tax=Kordiimonas lipolytica TaxID=1662421 RepID=A0ABV8UDU6_9PROT|nr:transporter substrate-binding domain-containing protein [Kordiimonas lipolytica]
MIKYYAAMVVLGVLWVARPVMAADVVVYTENYGDFNSVDDSGQVVGPAADLIRQVMGETGLDYDIKLVPWNRAYTLATKLDNALIYALLRQSEREPNFHWLFPVFETPLYLYGRQGEDRPITIEALKQGRYTAACMLGDASCLILRDLGMPKDKIFEVADSHRGEMKVVASGRADVFIAQELHHLEDGKLVMDPDFMKLEQLPDTQRFYLAAGKQVQPGLVEAVRQAYESLKTSGDLLSVHPQH